jgi:hypothetical protein
LEGFWICPSFKEPFLSRRAKPWSHDSRLFHRRKVVGLDEVLRRLPLPHLEASHWASLLDEPPPPPLEPSPAARAARLRSLAARLHTDPSLQPDCIVRPNPNPNPNPTSSLFETLDV